MKCPKCSGFLRTVDRQGVHLEQCDVCRGIFLDHGELEQILAAEQAYYGGGARGGHRDSPGPYRSSHGSSGAHRYPDSPGAYRKHNKRGFLGELFG